MMSCARSVPRSLEAKLRNLSLSCFQAKQAARSHRVFRAISIIPSVLWHNQQTIAHLVLKSKPRNSRGDFDAQITKPYLPILRTKPRNPKPPVLRPNREKPALLASLCIVQTAHSITRSIVRPSSTRPVLDHPWSSTPGLHLLPRSLLLPTMLHLSLTHHETSKCNSPHKIDKCRTTKTFRILIQTEASQLFITIKSRY
jgi:hypothetical protein